MAFDIHTIESAPEASKPLLEDSEKAYKFIPNLHGVMAESPALLEAYKTIGDIYAKANLNVLERQVVLLAINYENNCHYCMAAHSVIAQMEKMPADILNALREGETLSDPKLEALRSFAVKMTRNRGWVENADIRALHDAGYDNQTVGDVILAIGFKVLSNYTNHVAQTEIDPAFASQAWTKPEA